MSKSKAPHDFQVRLANRIAAANVPGQFLHEDVLTDAIAVRGLFFNNNGGGAHDPAAVKATLIEMQALILLLADQHGMDLVGEFANWLDNPTNELVF